MTKDELRIAVAEARGYVKKRCTERDAGGAIHRYTGWFNESEYGDIDVKLPDYPNSMDACMELLNEVVEATKIPYVSISSMPKITGWEGRACCEIYEHNSLDLLGCGVLVTRGEGKDFQEAICRAYLAFKEDRK